MNLATYASKNLFRRRGRTIMTVIGVVVAILVFSLIRTVVDSFHAGADAAAKDRIATRHKASITWQIPKRYIDDIRGLDGIDGATWAVWFGGKDPKERSPFFATFAADHETWFTVMDEMKIEPAVLEEWKKTPNGAVLGDLLAKTLQVKPGDKLMIKSDIYPGDWEFKVVGLYQPVRRTADRNTMVFRWDYYNNDPRTAYAHDQIGWVISRVKDAKASAAMQRKVDALFVERDDQTTTMSERAMQLSFLGGFTAILDAFDIVSAIIMLIMALILANTIAMSVRERTHEYGVLRAIGFQPGHLIAFILGESLLLAVVGGLVGVGLTMLFVNGALGPFIEDNMGMLFPYFSVPTQVLAMALGLAVALGTLAGLYPAYRASRIKITDALRRID